VKFFLFKKFLNINIFESFWGNKDLLIYDILVSEREENFSNYI